MSVALFVRFAHILLLLIALAAPAAAQQVLFDNPVRAGELTVYRDLRDEKAYYYAPANPRLATAANGLPQFSFFRYVENVRSGAKEEEAREGEGGGIIHALVTFGVTKDKLDEAQLALRRLVPGARIIGPIVPKASTFAVVSRLYDPKNPENELSTQVLGVGAGPVLDGEKASVSIGLTKKGARIMWEQFQTSQPNLDFVFEWTVDGFRGPIGGSVEANLDEIVKHQSFAAGVTGNFYGAQIKGAFDDLRKSKAITFTQVGDDAKLEAMITTAYDKLVALLFDKEPAAAAAAPAAAAGGDAAGDDDWMKRAATQLDSARKRSDEVLKDNNAIAGRNAERKAKREAADAAEKHHEDLQAQLRKAEAATPAADPATLATLKTNVEAARTDALAKRQEATKAGPDEALKDMPAEPGFALMATYQIKRSRVTGIYRMDFNKHLAETRVFSSRENVGDLRPLLKTGAFKQVNLDDPLYKQREIVTMIDGLNAEDFGQYINSVSLRLRKTHALGAVTDDEVRINRKNFNAEGANFKLLYGWKEDNDRSQWMDYEYQMVWSFFGGHMVEMPWTKASAGAITLSPPLQRRSVELQGDPKRLADLGVRAVNVKIFYRTAKDGPEQVKTVTLNAAGPTFVGRIDFVSPPDAVDYEYEIAWRLAGNREVSSGRQKTGFTILNLDELPKDGGE